MSDEIYQLVYSSAATHSFRSAELADLLERARANNARLNVTGLLLYHDRSFIQALEGKQTVVESLFEKIRTDPRHAKVVQLLARSLNQRQFPDWSMGFLSDHDAFESLPGFSDFMRQGATAAERTQAAKGILEGFRQGRFRNRVLG